MVEVGLSYAVQKDWMRLALAGDIHTENNTGMAMNLGLEQMDILLRIKQLDCSAAVSFKFPVRIIQFYLDGSEVSSGA